MTRPVATMWSLPRCTQAWPAFGSIYTLEQVMSCLADNMTHARVVCTLAGQWV